VIAIRTEILPQPEEKAGIFRAGAAPGNEAIFFDVATEIAIHYDCAERALALARREWNSCI
jgi:hypothetical protein